MSFKGIEIYYDIAEIPDRKPRLFGSGALDFRNEAMDHIEMALDRAGAGEWVGAEIGAGEVNFGFEVQDFDEAERVVLEAVKGTKFENIREIERRTIEDGDECEAVDMPWYSYLVPLLLSPLILLWIALGVLVLVIRTVIIRK